MATWPATPPPALSPSPYPAPAPAALLGSLKKLGPAAGAIVAVVVFGLLRLGASHEHSKEQAYLDADKPYQLALKADIKQVGACTTSSVCEGNLTKLLADNSAYLKWANSVSVPDKFKAAHAERVRGANLHDQGGRQLLSLLQNPPADRAAASSMLTTAENLIQQGDDAMSHGDELFKQDGVVLQS